MNIFGDDDLWSLEYEGCGFHGGYVKMHGGISHVFFVVKKLLTNGVDIWIGGFSGSDRSDG